MRGQRRMRTQRTPARTVRSDGEALKVPATATQSPWSWQ
jgi:hypothetical protein